MSSCSPPTEYFKGAPRVCQCLLLRLPFGSFLVLLMTHDEVCSGRGRLMRTSAVILMNECCPSQFYAGSPFLLTLLFHVWAIGMWFWRVIYLTMDLFCHQMIKVS